MALKSSQLAKLKDTLDSLVKQLTELSDGYQELINENAEVQKQSKVYSQMQKLFSQETGNPSELPPGGIDNTTARRRTRRIKDNANKDQADQSPDHADTSADQAGTSADQAGTSEDRKVNNDNANS